MASPNRCTLELSGPIWGTSPEGDQPGWPSATAPSQEAAPGGPQGCHPGRLVAGAGERPRWRHPGRPNARRCRRTRQAGTGRCGHRARQANSRWGGQTEEHTQPRVGARGGRPGGDRRLPGQVRCAADQAQVHRPCAVPMLVSIAAYSLFFGWTFPACFVLLIFVHEMGHVIELRRQGVPATAPLFIPSLGAFVGDEREPT